MRLIWAALLAGILGLGCQQTKPRGASPAGPANPKHETPAVRPGVVSAPVPARTVPGPRVTPINELSGKVAAVNPVLRFVVIDFYLSQLPQIGQLMSVYRQGQKVGEVKISGPEQNRNIAADITTGDARVGDDVRTD